MLALFPQRKCDEFSPDIVIVNVHIFDFAFDFCAGQLVILKYGEL